MKWERLEIMGVTVPDLDAAVANFTKYFGVQFETYDFPHGIDAELIMEPTGSNRNMDLDKGNRVAIDRSGFFEFVERPGEEPGYRNIHFKVDDLEEAKEHLTSQGLTIIAEYRAGTLREAVFRGPELYGVRLCVLQYDAASAIEAILERP